MASESGVTTSSARITSRLLPTARNASLGPLRHQCLPCLLLRRRRVNQDKQVASRTTKTSVPYVLTAFCGVSAARRSLAVTYFIPPASRTWLGTFGVVFRRSHCHQLPALSEANFDVVNLLFRACPSNTYLCLVYLSPSSHNVVQLNIDGSVRQLLQLASKIKLNADGLAVSLRPAGGRSSAKIVGTFSWIPSFLTYLLLVSTVFYTCSPHKQQRPRSESLHWRVCCQVIRPLLFHRLLLLRISTTALELTL